MRTLQYRGRDGQVHLMVQRDSVQTVVDVTSAVGGRGDMVAAIRRARGEQRSTRALLDDLAADPRCTSFELVNEGRLVTTNDDFVLDIPVTAPEVWAAGVSYLRSREARELESGSGNAIYAKVYAAERPELFIKDAGGRRTVGVGQPIHVRPDSKWNVPEPELALVLGADGTIVGYTIGNDVSSRQIEAENPLYLPQAKVYANSCSLGPAVLMGDGLWTEPFLIRLRILDAEGMVVFEGETSTNEMKRSFAELVDYLTRFNPIEDGTVLLTGTGIVPHDDFTLSHGQVVEIEVPGIGVLRNPVTEAPQRVNATPGGG